MTKADIGWTKADILNLIDTSDRAVERAVLAIYAKQTADEQQSSATRHLNARGFNSADASFGSYCAAWLLKGNKLNGKFLSRCRVMVRKYHAQLREDANIKLAKGLTAAFATLAERAPKAAPQEMVQTNFGDLYGDQEAS